MMLMQISSSLWKRLLPRNANSSDHDETNSFNVSQVTDDDNSQLKSYIATYESLVASSFLVDLETTHLRHVFRHDLLWCLQTTRILFLNNNNVTRWTQASSSQTYLVRSCVQFHRIVRVSRCNRLLCELVYRQIMASVDISHRYVTSIS